MTIKKSETTIAYKAFNKDMICRGFKYKVGETYEQEGEIALCRNGFHACEFPLDVFSFYEITDSAFAQVEQSGTIEKDEQKSVSSKITIKAAIDLVGLVKASIEWIRDFTPNNSKDEDHAKNASSEDHAKNASSGQSATNASSGHSAKNASSGDRTRNEGKGKNSICVAAGLQSRAKVGEDGALALTWYDGKRYRIAVGYAGEGEIKKDTWYEVGGNGVLYEVLTL